MARFWQQTWFRWAVAVAAIPVLAVAWWLGSPLFLDTEVDEEFPMSATAEIPPDSSREAVELQMREAAEAPDFPATEPMPGAGPTALLSGMFSGADSFHQGSGTATLYELEDGSRIVRLEDFEVTNGPDLHVLAVPAANPTGREDIVGYVDLGSLKGNIGSQNYDVPSDLDDIGSIVIYCVPFHVLFASAPLN